MEPHAQNHLADRVLPLRQFPADREHHEDAEPRGALNHTLKRISSVANVSGMLFFTLAFPVFNSCFHKTGMHRTPYYFRDYVFGSPSDNTKMAKLWI
jgi:hypothetical protein